MKIFHRLGNDFVPPQLGRCLISIVFGKKFSYNMVVNKIKGILLWQ